MTLTKLADNQQYSVNISSVLDYMQDPFRWLCKWVENRVPAEDAQPLRFGKLFHHLMELNGTGVSMPDAIFMTRGHWTLLEKSEVQNTPKWWAAHGALEDLSFMEEPILLWHDAYTFDIPVLEVETAGTIVHPYDDSILLKVRPDRVGVYKNRLWHVQHKAFAAGKNFGLYIDLSRRSYHEHTYAEHLVRKYTDWDYGGTFFNLYRKLKYRGKITLAEPKGKILHKVEELFFQHPMLIDLESPLHKNVMESILKHARNMRETERRYREYGDVPAPNENLNGGFFGNVVDPYFRVLTGEIELDNNEYFKDREDTYAVDTVE